MSPSRYESHYRSSWRFLAVFAAAAVLVLFYTSTALATSGKMAPSFQTKGGSVEAVALDVLCVDGTVINHEEEPLPGWTVTATYAGDEGSYPPLTTESNEAGEFHFDLPATGRWSFSVDVPDAWKPITEPSFEVNVTYGSAECINIRFKLEQFVTVYVHKINDKHQPLVGWTITATPGPDNPFAEPQTAVTDENGIATFYLPPGQWTFTEEPPAGLNWWRPISPADGEQSIDVVAPGPYTIRFKNITGEGAGCIEVIKRDVPPTGDAFGLPDWPIQVERANGTIAAEGETNAFGRIVFPNLPFGPYVVRETVLPGWEAASPTAYEVVLTRGSSGCQLIEFYNRQVENGFCIVGRKLDLNGMVGIPGWEIGATPEEAGGVVPEPVLTDGTGRFRIDLPSDDYRIPGSTYTVCEAVREGWTPVSPTCYTVTIPEQEGLCVEIPDDFVNRQTQRDLLLNVEAHARFDKKSGHQPDDPGGACRVQHHVKRGDTLSKLARRYDSSVQAIARANHIRNPNRIYVGQRLCIP